MGDVQAIVLDGRIVRLRELTLEQAIAASHAVTEALVRLQQAKAAGYQRQAQAIGYQRSASKPQIQSETREIGR
jgi:hypothetical protein